MTDKLLLWCDCSVVPPVWVFSRVSRDRCAFQEELGTDYNSALRKVRGLAKKAGLPLVIFDERGQLTTPIEGGNRAAIPDKKYKVIWVDASSTCLRWCWSCVDKGKVWLVLKDELSRDSWLKYALIVGDMHKRKLYEGLYVYGRDGNAVLLHRF